MTGSSKTEAHCEMSLHFIFIQSNKISEGIFTKRNLIVGCPSQRPKRKHHCLILIKITAKNNGCPSTQSGATTRSSQGETKKPTEENTLSVPFIVVQNVRAKRAKSNQVLAKLALLAMAPQRLNGKKTLTKNNDRKEKRKFNF